MPAWLAEVAWLARLAWLACRMRNSHEEVPLCAFSMRNAHGVVQLAQSRPKYPSKYVFSKHKSAQKAQTQSRQTKFKEKNGCFQINLFPHAIAEGFFLPKNAEVHHFFPAAAQRRKPTDGEFRFAAKIFRKFNTV